MSWMVDLRLDAVDWFFVIVVVWFAIGLGFFLVATVWYAVYPPEEGEPLWEAARVFWFVGMLWPLSLIAAFAIAADNFTERRRKRHRKVDYKGKPEVAEQ